MGGMGQAGDKFVQTTGEKTNQGEGQNELNFLRT